MTTTEHTDLNKLNTTEHTEKLNACHVCASVACTVYPCKSCGPGISHGCFAPDLLPGFLEHVLCLSHAAQETGR